MTRNLTITTVKDFINNSEMFAKKVEQMTDSMFDQTFVDEKYGSFFCETSKELLNTVIII